MIRWCDSFPTFCEGAIRSLVAIRSANVKLKFCDVAAIADRVRCCSVVRRCWDLWCKGLQCRQAERDGGQMADHLAQHATQRQAFSHWRHCILTYIARVREMLYLSQLICFNKIAVFTYHCLICTDNGLIMNLGTCSFHVVVQFEAFFVHQIFLIRFVDFQMCSEKAKQEKTAIQHHHLQLLVSNYDLSWKHSNKILIKSFSVSLSTFLYI